MACHSQTLMGWMESNNWPDSRNESNNVLLGNVLYHLLGCVRLDVVNQVLGWVPCSPGNVRNVVILQMIIWASQQAFFEEEEFLRIQNKACTRTWQAMHISMPHLVECQEGVVFELLISQVWTPHCRIFLGESHTYTGWGKLVKKLVHVRGKSKQGELSGFQIHHMH